MKLEIDCIPCITKQALELAKMTSYDNEIQKKILRECIHVISNFENFEYSPVIVREVNDIVKKNTNVEDPFKKMKDNDIKRSLELYPYVKNFLNTKENRLYWALKASSIGNSIDAAITPDVDIKRIIEQELAQDFTICDIEKFDDLLKRKKSTILIIGDNAGETVFDTILTEELKDNKLIYAVRSKPVLNDATYEDAKNSKFKSFVKIIESGSTLPGTLISECSNEFLDIFYSADVVISKGQGNFETLSNVDREIFFLLKAKCNLVAKRLKVNIGDYIFKFLNYNI